MERWIRSRLYPRYEVSNEGRVRGLKHNKILNPYGDGRGYLKVDLYNGSECTSASVHRLVADTFLDRPHERLEVNHIDGNKHNNSVDNLEWCTRSANLQHAYDLGLKKPPSYRPRQRKVRIVETGEEFDTLGKCARHINGCVCHIASCLNGQRKRHKGYHFEAVDD